MDAFRDAFSVARLISLANNQDILVENTCAFNPRHPIPSFSDWAPGRHYSTRASAPGSLHGSNLQSSTIIEMLRTRSELYAYFYFNTNNQTQLSATQLLCSLVTQLSVQVISPDKTLNALWTSYRKGQDFPSNSVLVSDALIPILREFTQPVYIVLDALDECSERGELLDVISKIVDAKLSHVHLLVTSRPEVPQSCGFVQQAIEVSLEGCVDDDIESYVTALLSKELGWIVEKKEEIKRGLLDRANGMFRLVSLQLEELRDCDGTETELDEALKNMPSSLNAIYDRILQNIKKPKMLANVCRTMNWLMFSRRPMTLAEIIDALAFNFDRDPLLFKTAERMRPDALLLACAGLITVSEGPAGRTIKLAHSSVREFFLLPDRTRPPGGSEISEQAAHHLLVRTFDRAIYSDDDLKRFPLTLYAVEYWASHLTLSDYIGVDNCKSTNELRNKGLISASREPQIVDVSKGTIPASQLIDEVLQLLQPDSAQYSTLLHLYDIERSKLKYPHHRPIPVASCPPLYVAASLGIGQVVWKFLEQGADANTKRGAQDKAPQAASTSEDTDFGDDETALYIASQRGHIEIARVLLDNGAEVNPQGGYYGNALQAASRKGHFELVRLLLGSGANVNAQGGHYRNALQAASDGGHIDILRLLLDSGADVNAPDIYGRNPLTAALQTGNTEIADLLRQRGATKNIRRKDDEAVVGSVINEGFE
ncbi:hypothetical protein B0H14DRAFT_2573573 [Mycena olivaceomarginata]|nr:hypothetical protein B0H14DRAFT_2573573 [Mycena olivaceomarginata]